MTAAALRWVGWYDANGRAFLSTWFGETKMVVVAPVPPSWTPHAAMPPGAMIHEIPQDIPHNEQQLLARDLHGLLVIVFT